MQFRAQHTVAEYSREIRQQDRGQIFAERRRRQQEYTKEFDFKQIPSLIRTYMDGSLCEEVRFEMLPAAIHFTDDDDHSHYTVRLLIETNGLVTQLRETVYDENIKLEYRLQSLQLLAQMLYSNYELVRHLMDQQILNLMITQARIAYQHSQMQFLSIALLGLGNAMSYTTQIREYYTETEVDLLFLQILEKFDDEAVKKNIARLMNDWFRSKTLNIKIELFRGILNHLICTIEDKEYMEDVIWFLYGFTSQALEQLKQQPEAIDPFIQSLIVNPGLTDFLKKKLQDTQYLGCVACVRAFSKMFKMISDQTPLQKIFYDDIRLLYRRAKDYEVNLTKLEVLKLMQIMHQHSECKILAEEFKATISYFSYSLKCQEQTLQAFRDCNFEIFDFTQLDTILHLCKNILMSDLKEAVKLKSVLVILLKLLPVPNLCLQVQEVLPQIESLITSENQELSEIAHTFVENYKLFYMK